MTPTKGERKVYKDGREPVMLRLESALKARLVAAAKRQRRSVNAEATLALERAYPE